MKIRNIQSDRKDNFIMALDKKGNGASASNKIMTFGDNRDLKKIISAKSTETQKRVNFNMSENKHQRLKATCARKGLSISDVMNDLVDNWLLKNE